MPSGFLSDGTFILFTNYLFTNPTHADPEPIDIDDDDDELDGADDGDEGGEGGEGGGEGKEQVKGVEDEIAEDEEYEMDSVMKAKNRKLMRARYVLTLYIYAYST